MAEVSRRLGSGTYRLAAFKSTPGHPLSGAEGQTETVSVSSCITGLNTCTRVKVTGQCQSLPPVSKRDNSRASSCTEPESENRVTERVKFPCQETEDKVRRLSRPVHDEIRKVNWDLTLPSVWPSVKPCDVLLWDSYDAATKPILVLKPIADQGNKLLHGPHSPFYLSPSNAQTQSRSRVNLTVSRMTCWSRRGVAMATFHLSETVSPEQVRAFGTVSLAEHGSGGGGGLRRRLKREARAHTSRAYSGTGRGQNSQSDDADATAPPLYRSKMAYYDVLRVSPSATQAQIKTAYYAQSFVFHPDKNPGSEEASVRFGEISEAYSVLGSVGLRRKYDRGILSQSDVRGAGRPSSSSSATTGAAAYTGGSTRASGPQQQQQQQQQQRQRQQSGRLYDSEGKPMFDFDAFYQAHYGEQLQRERELRARKEERVKRRQEEGYEKRRLGRMMEIAVTALLTAGGVLFVSLFRA